ncbi:MAG: type I glyceraldehyde-3-phosphate dehydrogenase [Bacteroidetes bacterium]|nr:type I glyceraldehyde-3-phosphate dehydrogenase [Bacteroidota bacterium]HET6243728.1 type I glyceraldehyde-3-phosphate dehydrogenase [Bacteroidia bacterium]
MTRVAINGLGRIGRAAFKIIMNTKELELVAVNDISSPDDILYLLKHDSVYGIYDKFLEYNKNSNEIKIDGKIIKVYSEKEPVNLPWKEQNIDIVFECSGKFTNKQDMQKHLDAGAEYVILSAPGKGDNIPTVIPGVNEPNSEDRLISTASCTTNCIAPVMEIMDRNIGIKKAIMTTIHAYTSSQAVVDMPNKSRRRGRSAGLNLVPTSTGAAKATSKALPQFENIFDGVAIRGPVPSGSIADITLITNRDTSVEEINKIFQQESISRRYDGILGTTGEDLVSSDIIKDPRASIVDTQMTMVVDGNLVKIMSWYDNEWGYVNQMVKAGISLAQKIKEPVS